MITLTAQTLIDGKQEIFDRRNIISLDCELIDRSDIELPSWGIISNGANLSFKDSDSRFLEYAKKGLLKEDIVFFFYLKNTLNGAMERVGTYFSKKWDYDVENSSVSVSLDDGLEKWQEINVDEFAVKTSGDYRLTDIMLQLYGKSKRGFDITNRALKILESSYSPTLYMRSGSLWNCFSKVCQACGLYIYVGANGNVIIDSEF